MSTTSAVPDISIVIITFNSKSLLIPCVESARVALRGIPSEIIIVDNGSVDGSAEWLREQADIDAIFNVENRGVAPARNQGLRKATGRYVLILDVDTIVPETAFRTLIDSMDTRPDAGLGAPKLTDGDGTLQNTCRYYPTALSKLYRRIPLGWAKRKLREEFLEDWAHDEAREVDYVIGACQIFRAEAMKEIGFLDESIFYGPEDIDYCVRMWAGGWAVVYFPQAVIVHLERRITKKIFSKVTWKHAVGLFHFFRKYGYVLNTGKLPGCRNPAKRNK